jgi:hypothetical protein
LASGPAGNPPIHHRHHLTAVATSPPADWLQDDTAKGSQAVYLHVTGGRIQQVQLQAKLEKEGILAPQGDCSEDRQGVFDNLLPDIVGYGVISKGWLGAGRT